MPGTKAEIWYELQEHTQLAANCDLMFTGIAVLKQVQRSSLSTNSLQTVVTETQKSENKSATSEYLWEVSVKIGGNIECAMGM